MPIKSSERNKSSASSRVIILIKISGTGACGVAPSLGAYGDGCRQKLFHEYIEIKQGCRISLAPAVHLPLRANVFHIGMVGEIQHKLIRAAIKLLREGNQGFGAPIGAIG